MKRITLLLCTLLTSVGMLCAQQQTSTLRNLSPEEAARHKERIERRAERLQEFEHYMDSLILSRNYQFNPQTMQQQPAGAMRQLTNPHFIVSVWDTTVDVCLPYLTGYVPPYHLTIINTVLPYINTYYAEQTDEGWTIKFDSSLFTAGTYTFTFEIWSKTGSATLTITNPWYNPVQYNGSITALY